MRMLNRATDLIILNLLFVVSCLPVVTIGPAAAAMYSVIFAMGTTREDGVLRPYLRAFRENFRTAVLTWLLLLFAAGALLLDIALVSRFGGGAALLAPAFGLLLAIECLAAAVIFPLISLFQNTVIGTVKSGLVLGLGNLPRSILIALLWLFPIILVLRMPAMFLTSSFAWVVFYFSAVAYGSSRLLRKVFISFLPEDYFSREELQ